MPPFGKTKRPACLRDEATRKHGSCSGISAATTQMATARGLAMTRFLNYDGMPCRAVESGEERRAESRAQDGEHVMTMMLWRSTAMAPMKPAAWAALVDGAVKHYDGPSLSRLFDMRDGHVQALFLSLAPGDSSLDNVCPGGTV